MSAENITGPWHQIPNLPRWPIWLVTAAGFACVGVLSYHGQYLLSLSILGLLSILLMLHAVQAQRLSHALQSVRQLLSLDEERRASVEKFRVLFEYSTLAHLLFDDQGIIDCNNAAIKMLRCKDKKQVLSLHPAELSPEFQPDGRRSMEKCREMDAIAFEQGYHRFEWMHQRLDGEVFPVEVQLTPVRLKGKLALLVVWQDITDRRRTEEDLQQARERYELAVLGSNDGLWDWNVKTGETYFSPRYKSMIGYDDHELGNNYEVWESHLHPEDRETSLQTLNDYFAGKTSHYQAEFRMRAKDGSYRWILARGILRRDAEGRPERMAGSHTDITDRKHTEEELRANEERLKLAVQGSEEGIWDWNVPTGEVFYSPRWTEMLGYAQDEIEGHVASWERLVHPDDAERVMKVLNDHLAGKTPVYEAEHRLRTKDGSWKWVLDHGKIVSRDKNGEVLRMAGTHKDIDARKRVEEEARAHRQLLECIGRAQERFISTANATQVFEQLLEDLLRLTGCAYGCISEAMQPGPELASLAVATNRADDPRRYTDLVETVSGETWFQQAMNGTDAVMHDTSNLPHVPFEALLCVPFRRGDHGNGMLVLADRPGGFEPKLIEFLQPLQSTCASLVDAYYQERQREQTELDLQAAKEAAEQASRAKSDFLANMSHEVRTPIAAVLGFADMMLDPDLNAEQRLHAIHSIRRNGRHLLQVINDILDLSKIEAGKLETELSSCAPWPIIVEVVSSLRVRADEKGVRLRARAEGQVPARILSDPTRVRQILMNLISNSIKFTDAGRNIEVTLRFVHEDVECVEFEVKDEGIGIPPQQLSQLFRPFHQGDNSPARKYGGTGLGLSISKRLAESLGGSIEAASVEGEGSTFTLRLAAHQVEEWIDGSSLREQTEYSASEPLEGVRLRGRVLVVDDSLDNQRVLGHILSGAGLGVEFADNGRSAIACMHAKEFDVVFMDMQMPELDGYEATTILRRAGHREPIIALTAHAMRGDRDRCLQAGCTDYLTKPVEARELLRVLAQYLPGVEESDSPDSAEDAEYRALVREFTHALPDRVRELRAAAADYQQLARSAHKLKGAGAMFGYPVVSELAGLIEIAVREGQEAALLDELLEDLEGQVQRIVGSAMLGKA